MKTPVSQPENRRVRQDEHRQPTSGGAPAERPADAGAAGFSRREFLCGATGAALTAALHARLHAAQQNPAPRQPDPRDFTFSRDFLWGASTSAYQIEGAARQDGRGASIWDEFCTRPGAILEGQTGDVACDHYHRYREDVRLMRRIGLRAYRFSVSWPRIFPEGVGKANPRGLSFYSRLIDELLRHAIAPVLTLYHWDYPLALQRRGGWLHRDSPDWFADYAAVLADQFSGRVRYWITLNEPRSFLGGGYVLGVQAPGLKLPLADVLRAGHHLNLAHGKAVQAIRAAAARPVEIGIAPDCSPALPATSSEADVAAARRATFSANAASFTTDGWWRNNAWWLDPIFRGEYPADALAAVGAAAPEIRPGEMETIRQPLDFFGVNIYGGWPMRAGANGEPESVPFPADIARTALGWEITPEALHCGPKFLHERYALPLLITENGAAFHDAPSGDGRVRDAARVDFMARYLAGLRRAMQEGVPVRGYFHWSLLDNFEWQHGYRERFGLIYVDHKTQKRTLKDSALWYREVIANSGSRC